MLIFKLKSSQRLVRIIQHELNVLFYVRQICLDALLAEFDEVNQAADKLLVAYAATSTRIPALGRDEKKIYPFTLSSSTSTDETNSEYDYATNDEYDEDDDDDDDDAGDDLAVKSSSTTTTTTATSSPMNDIDIVNYDQVDTGDSDWDTRNDDVEKIDSTFDDDNDEITIDEQNQQAFINEVRSILELNV
jgi:hypothetical protein